MSDVFWQAMFAFLATAVISWMQLRTKGAVDLAKVATVEAAEGAAIRVAEVKKNLLVSTTNMSNQLERVEEMGEKNHALLNGGMEIQLQIAATALRRIADTSSHEDDLKAARFAEQRLAEHRAKMAAAAP